MRKKKPLQGTESTAADMLFVMFFFPVSPSGLAVSIQRETSVITESLVIFSLFKSTLCSEETFTLHASIGPLLFFFVSEGE